MNTTAPAAYDALRLEAKAVAIEAQGRFEIVHAQGDDGDSRLHGMPLRIVRGLELFYPYARGATRMGKKAA
jgi:hypothetical protein